MVHRLSFVDVDAEGCLGFSKWRLFVCWLVSLFYKHPFFYVSGQNVGQATVECVNIRSRLLLKYLALKSNNRALVHYRFFLNSCFLPLISMFCAEKMRLEEYLCIYCNSFLSCVVKKKKRAQFKTNQFSFLVANQLQLHLVPSAVTVRQPRPPFLQPVHIS